MILEKQLKESSLPPERMWTDVYDQQVHENIDSNRSGDHGHTIQNEKYFIAKVRPLNSQDFIPPPKHPTLEKKKNWRWREFSLLSELLYDCHHEINSHICIARRIIKHLAKHGVWFLLVIELVCFITIDFHDNQIKSLYFKEYQLLIHDKKERKKIIWLHSNLKIEAWDYGQLSILYRSHTHLMGLEPTTPPSTLL
jgi:hypothetical protein